MLDITQLNNESYVLEHIDEVYPFYKQLDAVIEKIKETVKQTKETIDLPNFEIKYSSYNKMVPVNLDVILQQYPIAQYPDCYNISLSAKAGDIIMEPDLVEYKPIESVKFTFKKE